MQKNHRKTRKLYRKLTVGELFLQAHLGHLEAEFKKNKLVLQCCVKLNFMWNGHIIHNF